MSPSAPPRRSALAACVVLLAASVTAALPAHASPVFTDAETYLEPYAQVSAQNLGSATCSQVLGVADSDVPVVENGPAVTSSTSPTANYVNSENGADTASASGAATARGQVASAGGTLSSLDFRFSASAMFTNALGTSVDCNRYFGLGFSLDYQFTITKPGFLSVRMTNEGETNGEIYLLREMEPNNVQRYIELIARGVKVTQDTKVYLPAGTYSGYFEGRIVRYTVKSFSAAGEVTAHGDFTLVGSRTSKVSGKGKKFLKLPRARSCAEHTLTPRVTSNKARAGGIKQVQFFVNGKKVKKVGTPRRGAKVKLKIADNVTADVRAVIRTKGKGSKPYEVRTRYEACS